MIKVFCDLCKDEIEEWDRCSSDKPAFDSLMTFIDGNKKPHHFSVKIDMTQNGHPNDVCKRCVMAMTGSMTTYQGEDDDA